MTISSRNCINLQFNYSTYTVHIYITYGTYSIQYTGPTEQHLLNGIDILCLGLLILSVDNNNNNNYYNYNSRSTHI